ncbi:unnamed protein product [Rhodiola kirilowii]
MREENQTGPGALGTPELELLDAPEALGTDRPGPVPGSDAEKPNDRAPLPFPMPARAPKR